VTEIESHLLPLRNRGIPMILVKGFATEAFYPSGYQRQFDDIDLAVPSVDAFWLLASHLKPIGYEVKVVVLAERPDAPTCMGMAKLAMDRGLGDLCEIEVQIGAFPLHWFSEYRFEAEFWNRAGPLISFPLEGPAPLDAAIILLGEMLERDAPRARDAIDLMMVARQLTPADASELAAAADRLALWRELTTMRTLLRGLGDEGEAAASRLPTPSKIGARLPWRALERAAHHDLPFARRRMGLLRAVLRAACAVGYDVVKQRGMTQSGRAVIGRLAARLDVRQLWEKGHFLQFIPIASRPIGDTEWWSWNTQPLLLTPIGPLLPMPLGILPRVPDAPAYTSSSPLASRTR
jgi:hypothetical protein